MGKNINRFVGEYPKIGIRPVIDGREQGVRESLEKQTRDMALSLKNLLEKKIRYPNGKVVECIVFDGTIGGVYEAAQCQDVFRRENVSVSITVTPSWCYGTEVMDMDPLSIKAVWGFNGTERPGAVYLAAALAGYSQMGLPAFSIYGHDVQEADDNTIPCDVEEKLIRFAKAGLASSWLRGKSYLSLGSTSMGIAGSCVDPKFFQKYLGMRNEYVDMTEIKRRIDKNIFDQEEFEKAYEWTKKNCKEGKDVNPEANQRTSQEKDEIWKFVIKMTIIIRDLMNGNPKLKEMGYGEESLGHNALISGFQGQRHWTDHYPNGDFSEAILNSSFDWNGIREPFLVATENDSLNGVAMSFGHLLTGSAQMFSDVRTYWSPEAVKKATGWETDAKAKHGFIHLINSGSSCLDACGQQTDSAGRPTMKAYKDISNEEVVKCLNATSWHSAVDEYFRGGGYSSHFVSKEGMKLTMARINLIDGLGPVLQIAEGYSIELPDEVHKKLDERTDETWPTTWFVPNLTGKGAFTDVYSVMANWGANHGAISFGHIGADLITMASMLRIPVCMHNVSDDKIFRPSVWGSFGGDSFNQDFNACKNFGSLYGK